VAGIIIASRALLRLASPADWLDYSLFSGTEYASPLLRPFLSSPFDFLMTGVAAGSLVALLLYAVEAWRLTRWHRRRRVAGAAATAVFVAVQLGAGAALAALLALHQALLRDTVANTSLDLLHFSLHPWSMPRFALQVGLIVWHASTLGCGVLLLRAAVSGWAVPRPDTGLRAATIGLWALPLVIWQLVTASCLFLLSVGPLIAGAIMLLMDRIVGTGFFLPDRGGEPLLWQHLFWFFGHPEVYVLLLPPLGAVLEVLPAFARKPIFGYRLIVWATIAAGGLSFIVWAHHMFVSGMDPRLAMPFSVTTILISVPFALIVFALIATLWRGSIAFETPMLWALGFVAMFTTGGLTGIFLGSAPSDIYMNETYFVVAHFHYTLFSAVFFGGFAAIYYWYPKMFGRMLSPALGKLHFWLTLVFFNLTFFPMHWIGIAGMVRRIANPLQYDMLVPHQWINVFTTVSLIGLIAAQVPFFVNYLVSMVRGRPAPVNPWEATTLEWTAPSPPPHGNWGAALPAVERGPYEYSVPGAAQDWLPQRIGALAAARGGRA